MKKLFYTILFLLMAVQAFALLPSYGSGGSSSVEGTAVLSTGEAGGTKFLREDGDGTSSWQVPAGGGDITSVGDCTTGACAGPITVDIIGNVQGNLTGDVVGNASTATALAADPLIAGQGQ